MAGFDPDFAHALNAETSPVPQQGMSPNTASALQEQRMGDMGESQVAGAGETSLAMRAMAVSSPSRQVDQSWTPTPVEQREFVGMATTAGVENGQAAGVAGQALVMGAMRTSDANMSEAAAWSMEAFGSRRNLPAWMQRIGTFFQEMRSHQAVAPLWTPSPFPSPTPSRPRQRALGSQASETPPDGTLFSREQWQQMQDMEGRAPLLYGAGQGAGGPRSGDGSSGDSTREVVEAEVKRQMQGLMSQLEVSRKEASQLRVEVERLRATSVSGTAASSMPPVSGPTASSMPPVSGLAASSMPQVSGLAASSMPQVSGLAASSMPQVSGLAASSMPPVSGLAASNTVSGLAALSIPSVSGLAMQRQNEPNNPFKPSSSPPQVPALMKHVEFEEVPQGPTGSPEVYGGYLRNEPARDAARGLPRDAPQRVSGEAGGDGSVVERSKEPVRTSGSMGGHVQQPVSDTVTKLLEGLEKVISGKSVKGHEEVGRTPVDVPKLPEVSDSASVDFGDWLHCLENVMGDISAGSAEWWGLLKEAAQEFYDRYQASDQFVRISMKPTASRELLDPRWVRVDRRAASMILGAVPEEIKRELVATRTKSTLEVLCRLMVLYRPGSASEKSLLLKKLEEPGAAGSPQEAVEALRLWLRVYQRARDLALVTPDPSILLKALDGLAKRPLQENAEVTFRMQLLRYHLKVDITPTIEGILAIHRAYLAEFEQMAMRKGPKKGINDGSSNSPTPKMKAIGGKGEPQGPPRDPVPGGGQGAGQQKPCRFFLTDEGCRRGKSCKFEHVMDKDKRERCWTCGSKQHTSKSCPTKSRGEQSGSPTSQKGGSGASSKKGEGGQEPPSIQKVMEAAEVLSSTSTTTPSSSASTSVTTSAAEDPVQGVPVDQLLENAHRMMKAFIEGQQKSPTFKMLQCPGRGLTDLPPLKRPADWEAVLKNMGTCKQKMGDEKMGLLDSGATHALRPALSQQELEGCTKAEVTLAGDQKVDLPQTQSGVILAEEAQPIVPLGSLVKTLGYEFVWNSRGCRLRHDSRPEIQVFTRSSCPEVRECDALRLIAELESQSVEASANSAAELRAAILAVKNRKPCGWKGYLQEYVRTGDKAEGLRAVFEAPFMQHVPVEDKAGILESMPCNPEEAWKLLKKWPMNRAKRRQLWRAKDWIIHLFAGKETKNDPIKQLAGEVLEVDINKGADVLSKDVYALLLWAAAQGRIKGVIGGPPCRTFSLLRYREGMGDSVRLPRPVRSARFLWGMPNLSPGEQQLVAGDNKLLLRMIWLWLVAEASSEEEDCDQWSFDKVAFGLEHPDDPREFLDEENGLWEICPSVWRTPLMEQLETLLGLVKYQFDQGAYGHEQKKPTAFLANMEMDLQARDARHEWPKPASSSAMAEWAPGFRREIAKALLRKELQGGGVKARAMSSREAAEWRAHLDANHWPYRRDCSVCLAASGSGRPARKVLHRDAYVLSLDVAGAFRDQGVDEKKGKKYRFALVATYVFPKGYKVPEDQPVTPPGSSEASPVPPGSSEASPVPPGSSEASPVTRGGPVEELGIAEEEVDDDWLETYEEEETEEGAAEGKDIEAEEEEWKKMFEDLKKPMEFQVLRFVIPLEKHRGREVLEAVQEIYVTLKSWGMPLSRIHSDRAKEFRTKPLRKWCRERDVYQTYTEGLAPTQNAVAENGVKWVKSRARLLLQAGGVEKKYWPCAMKEACDAHNRRMLARPGKGVRFGAVVWIKTKKGSGPFDPKWERGTYMGPTEDVRGGHVVLLEDGTWLRTLHVRLVRDDEYVEVKEPEYEADWVKPSQRLREKTTVRDPGLKMMSAYKDEPRNKLVERLLVADIWESKEAAAKRPQLREVPGPVEDRAYLTLGAYQHGGIVSITKATEKHEEVVRLASALLRHDFPNKDFTSIALVKNAVMPIHRDSYNKKESSNLVSPLKVTRGSGIWQEMKIGDEFKGRYEPRWFNGKEVPGQVVELSRPQEVNPSRLHEPVLGEDGPRVLVVGFTIAAAHKLEHEKVKYLQELGCWPVTPPKEEEEVDRRRDEPGKGLGGEREDELVVPGGRISLKTKWSMSYKPEEEKGGEKELDPVPAMPLEGEERRWLEDRAMALRALIVDEERCADLREEEGGGADESMNEKIIDAEEELDFVQELLSEDSTERQEQSIKAATHQRIRLAKLAADVTTENVEGILKELKEPLTVTHTVSLPEVKAHLPEWIPSMAKEVNHLEGNGTLVPIPLAEAKRLQERGEVTLVPAKTVHTVKPPDVAAVKDKKENEDEKEEEPSKEREHATDIVDDNKVNLFKRKTRLVICGNYIKGETEVFTTAASAESVRCGVAFAAQRNWEAAITDINSAFTLTPMSESSVKYAVTVPKVIVDAGCAPPNTAYRVERLLYGLKEAPRLWGNFRDRRIRRARIRAGHKECKFVQMETDPALWRLVPLSDEEETIAMMIVYVDDVLFLGGGEEIKNMYAWLTKGGDGDEGWKCSELE